MPPPHTLRNYLANKDTYADKTTINIKKSALEKQIQVQVPEALCNFFLKVHESSLFLRQTKYVALAGLELMMLHFSCSNAERFHHRRIKSSFSPHTLAPTKHGNAGF